MTDLLSCVGVSEMVNTINQYLIRASNNQATPQAALTIASSNPITSQSEPTSYTFLNHTLSLGYGRHISRCRELPILFEEQDSLVGILTPLNNAIGFMCFEDAGKELVHQTTHIMIFPHHDDCIPITIVRHKTKHYVVCIDSSMRVISCLINLNFDNITRSYLQCASLGSFPPSVDFSEISNFVYVGGDLFIFAVQNIVYEYYPDRLSLASVSGCTLPHLAHNVRLVYNDIDTVLMYYNTNEGADIVVVFDLANECSIIYFIDLELQYSCFNGFNVFVYPSDSAILYEMHEPTENALQIDITGTNFTTGFCFGNASHSYFIYVDWLKGTLLLNIASGNNTLISDDVCLREYCWTPVLYQEMYLVLQEGGYLVVRNIEDNYKPVINVSNGNTYLIGFLTGTPYEKEIDVHVGNGSGYENIYLGIVGGVFALVILAAGFTLAMWKVAKTISG